MMIGQTRCNHVLHVASACSTSCHVVVLGRWDERLHAPQVHLLGSDAGLPSSLLVVIYAEKTKG